MSIKKDSNPPQHYVNDMIVNYQGGKSIEAEKLAVYITQNYPDYQLAWRVLGALLGQKGKNNEANNANQKAVDLNPKDPDALNSLGLSLKNLGKFKEAETVYKKSLKIKPDYAEAYCNLGNLLQMTGKLIDAEDCYNKAIQLKPELVDSYSNLGGLLKEIGRLEESKSICMKAISLNPNYALAYNNLGVTLHELGDFYEAEINYRKAIELNPQFSNAYSNLGVTLQKLDKLDEAEENIKEAIKLKPYDIEALFNLGSLFIKSERFEEAIEVYNSIFSIEPNNYKIYYNIGIFLKDMVFQRPNPKLLLTLNHMVDQKTSYRPSDIISAVISLLRFETNIKLLFKIKSPEKINRYQDKFINSLYETPLLLKIMKVCPLTNIDLEESLLKLRSNLLLSNFDFIPSKEILEIQSSIAIQCFMNEYIYRVTDKELKTIQIFEDEVEKKIANGEQPNPYIVLCLASYKPLYDYSWSEKLKNSNDINEVYTKQFLEPKDEIIIRSKILSYEKIIDKTSKKVRKQYESNPYPRWTNIRLNPKANSIAKEVELLDLKIFNNKIINVKSPKILIAGCGTGQHSISTASRFLNSSVLAIDLSFSSLAYAARKTMELGIKNIEYMQADILNLKNLNKKFDIIESSGVLHHMDKPIEGWKILTKCLKKNGLMKIGLYSQLARRDIKKIRDEISLFGIEPNQLDMISYRNKLVKSNEEHHINILDSYDFYSLSSFRDLLFNAQEHNFTIKQIKNNLQELGLIFCGFEGEKIISSFKKINDKDGDLYDLSKWEIFEQDNPNIFSGMYQFWCQKT